MQIYTYDKDGRAEACAELLKDSPNFESLDLLCLLPIPTSRDGVHLGRSELDLYDPMKYASAGALFVGYEIPDGLREKLTRAGAFVCDVAGDEVFLAENGALTAEGILGVLLTSEPAAPRDLSVGVVGYGRIGKELTRLLLCLGSGVKVYTGRESVRLELCESGVAAEGCGPDTDLSDVDILINTAPAAVFGADFAFPVGLRIIDLASGKNFTEGRAERFPSLPAVMFPFSAGAALARSVQRLLPHTKEGGR